MLEASIKEILAGTVNRDLVEDIDGMDATYVNPLMEDYTDELFITMSAALRNYLFNSAQKVGYTVSAMFDRSKGFSEWSAKDAEALRKRMGSTGVGSSLSVRPGTHGGKKGYVVSIPIMHENYLFSHGGSTTFGCVRGADPTVGSGENFYANEAQRKLAVHLFGREGAQAATVHNKPVSLTVYDPEVMLASGPAFDLAKTTSGAAELQQALKKNFMGFRFMSPPLQSTVTYSGKLKDGVRLTYKDMAEVDQVANPKDYYSFILQSRKWSVYFDLFIPEDYARYQTQTPSGPINLSMLNMFWALWLLGDVGENQAFEAVSAVSSLKNVRDLNKTQGRDYRAQIVNGEGLSISPDAYPYYVPTVDNIDVYEDEFSKFGAHEDGSWSLRAYDRLPGDQYAHGETQESKRANKREFPKNRIIYTDFCNFRIAYSDSEGLSKTKNIEDWMALRPTDAANILNRKLFIDRTWNKSVLTEIDYVLRNRMPELEMSPTSMLLNSDEWQKFGWDEYTVKYLATNFQGGLGEYFQALTTTLVTNYFRNIPEGLEDAPTRLDDVQFKHLFNGAVPGLQWVGKALSEVAKRIRAMDETALNNYMVKRSVINSMKECGIVMALAENGERQDVIFRTDREDRRSYLQTVKPRKGEHTPKALPFVEPDRFLLPHQVRVDGIMENNNPNFVILAADAGGGKTLMVLRDVMARLNSGKSKRPILCMPDNLIRNYIADAVYMFGAGLNCIPITTDSLASHGAEGLLKIVQSAPKNTVLLTSYRFISGSTEQVYYGTDVMDYNGNLELLRSFDCDAIYCDESHFLRNDSGMTKATRRFAYSIPYRVLATGTLVNKELSDVANQVSIFLPSLFGNKSDFQEEYAEAMRGGTVVAWKPGAEAALRKKISEHCLVIQCKRKEWAALLPNRVESLHVIGDADFRQGAWYQTYQAILTETVELIKKDAQLVKKLAQSESLSDDEEINIEALLKPYIARLEMFLTAPEKDEVGDKVLKGKDRIGPKIGETVRLCREHFSKNIPGKILIFTSYHNSADSIYENMPADLKKMAIRYHSENSASDLGEFERNPEKKILIGTENTLNTGHNFQMASRIIRIESTWTPGNLEQSMARVYRPDPKNMTGIDRKNIYLDWVIVNWTIDITKLSRLISRVLNKALFDEHDNHAFQDLPNLPVVSMSLDSIAGANDFNDSMLDYAEGYAQYLEIVRKDLEDYRTDPANELVLTKLATDAKGMDGAGLLALCPYSPDQSLPPKIMDEFKLVRISDYARDHGGEAKGVNEFDAKGLFVHTERGEGEVLRSSGSTVRVKLRDGSTAIFDKMNVFVITSHKLTPVPVRRRLAENAKLPIINNLGASAGKIGKETTVAPPAPPKAAKGEKPLPSIVKRSPGTTEEKSDGVMPVAQGTPLALEIYSIYDMLAIDLEDVDALSKKDIAKLEELGFRTGGKYSMCDIPNLAKFDLFLEKLEENYVVAEANMKVLRDLRKAFTGGKGKLFTAHRAMGMEMKNFWRIQSKPAAKNELRPYPIVWEGDLHIAVRHFKQPAALTVKQKLRVPGVTWQVVEDDYMMFCRDKQDVIQKVNKIQKAGFMVKKPKAFQKSLALIKMVKKKDE